MPSRIAGDDVTAYKPPWDSKMAYAALQSTGMWESTGSVFWCGPVPRSTTEERTIAGVMPTWRQVIDSKASEFMPESNAGKTMGRQRNAKVRRYVFRRPITVIMDDVEKAKNEAQQKAEKEAEEKAKREVEEKAKREVEEKAKKEAEENVRKKAEEKAQKEAEEKKLLL